MNHMPQKYYVYVLRSQKDDFFYTGFSKNLENRMNLHKNGKVISTKNRHPLELVYYEVSFNLEDAIHREKYLKTTYGHRYLKNRLKNMKKGMLI